MDRRKSHNGFTTVETPEFYELNAEETRARADTFRDPSARASMEYIARGYDRMALMARALLRSEVNLMSGPLF